MHLGARLTLRRKKKNQCKQHTYPVPLDFFPLLCCLCIFLQRLWPPSCTLDPDQRLGEVNDSSVTTVTHVMNKDNSSRGLAMNIKRT